jgi:RNA polymerase sigma-70 factor (ECF subfamily)
MSKRTHTDLKIVFKEAYNDHSDALFRFAYYKLSDREKAKDVVQDTFVKVWEYMASDAEEIVNIKALLYRIATNAIIDNYRKKKELSLDSLVEEGFDPNDLRNSGSTMIDESEADMIIKAIHGLDQDDRALMLMRYIDGLSVKEIALATGQRENTVSVRIHRAIKTLKDVLKVDILTYD